MELLQVRACPGHLVPVSSLFKKRESKVSLNFIIWAITQSGAKELTGTQSVSENHNILNQGQNQEELSFMRKDTGTGSRCPQTVWYESKSDPEKEDVGQATSLVQATKPVCHNQFPIQEEVSCDIRTCSLGCRPGWLPSFLTMFVFFTKCRILDALHQE